MGYLQVTRTVRSTGVNPPSPLGRQCPAIVTMKHLLTFALACGMAPALVLAPTS